MVWGIGRRAVSCFVACALTFACYASEPSREPDVGDEIGDADCRVGCVVDSFGPAVCGVDGRTYGNSEVAQHCCHVEIAHMGACEDADAGNEGDEVDADAVADADEIGDAGCLVGCSVDAYSRPVCGVDGRTYGNPEVAQNCCHVEIAHWGACGEGDAWDAYP